MKMYRYILALILLASVFEAKAYFLEGIIIGGGITTSKILGDNPATKPILPTDSTAEQISGGSFNAIAPGFEVKALVPIDEKKLHNIPIGIILTNYSSGERIPISAYTVINLWHSVTNLAFYTGYEYSYLNLKDFIDLHSNPERPASIDRIPDVFFFVGADVRANLFLNGKYTFKEKYILFPENNEQVVKSTKPDAFRLGAYFRTGVRGKLADKLSVNIAASAGVVNLVGKDDERGELLTPFTLFESKEGTLYTFNLSILLQYSF